METPWIFWSCAGLIIFFASVIQSTIGFGFGLIAVPLLLGAGFELPEAVAMTMTTSLAQRLHFGWVLRSHIPWRSLWTPVITSIVFLFLGILTLGVLANQSQVLARQLIGGLLIVLVLLRTLVRIKPRDHLHPGWGVLAGAAGGFLGGMMNIGGPPMVLWTYAHNWSQQTLRVAMVGGSMPILPFHMSLLFWRFGLPIGRPLLIGLAFAPLVLLGTWIGMEIGKRFHVDLLRTIVAVALILMGLIYLLGPLLS